MPAKPPMGLPRPWFLRWPGASSGGSVVPVWVEARSSPLGVVWEVEAPDSGLRGPFVSEGSFAAGLIRMVIVLWPGSPRLKLCCL